MFFNMSLASLAGLDMVGRSLAALSLTFRATLRKRPSLANSVAAGSRYSSESGDRTATIACDARADGGVPEIKYALTMMVNTRNQLEAFFKLTLQSVSAIAG
jgi:hypothetical protein